MKGTLFSHMHIYIQYIYILYKCFTINCNLELVHLVCNWKPLFKIKLEHTVVHGRYFRIRNAHIQNYVYNMRTHMYATSHTNAHIIVYMYIPPYDAYNMIERLQVQQMLQNKFTNKILSKSKTLP